MEKPFWEQSYHDEHPGVEKHLHASNTVVACNSMKKFYDNKLS